MTRQKLYTLFLLGAALWAFTGAAFAQNDVLVRVMVLPPYPMNLQELVARQNETAVELQNITNRQLELALRIRVYSDDTGVELRTNPDRPSGAPISLAPGAMMRLTGADLQDYFNSTNLLYRGITESQLRESRAVPEGYYFVCGQVVDARTLVPLSQEVCSTPIALMALEPPRLRLTNPLAGEDTVTQTLPQNLVFAWNIPSNVPARAIPQLEYTLHLIEVPEGIDPQTIVAAAPANTPGFTTVGTNLYVYGPAAPQLLLGQRYVATITARHPDGSLTFRNAGRSEPISFVFGASPIVEDPTTNRITPEQQNPAITEGSISGQVRWAYRSSEVPSSSNSVSSSTLLTTDASALLARPARSVSSDTSVGQRSFPLPGTRVRLLIDASAIPPAETQRFPFSSASNTLSRDGVTIATTQADAQGQYTFTEVLPMHLNHPGLRVEFDGGPQFSTQRVSLSNGLANSDGSFDLGEVRLLAHSFRLSTKVLSTTVPPGATVTAEVLARSSLVARQPYLLAGQEATDGREVSYNGESWRVLVTITDSTEVLGLIRPAYPHEALVLRAVASSGEEAAVALDIPAASQWQLPTTPPVHSYYQGLDLRMSGFTVSGTVDFEGAARAGARVQISYVDPVSGNRKQSTPVFTDPSGFYQISGLPFLPNANAYEIACTDTRLSPTPYTKTISWSPSETSETVDFTLHADIYVAAGRIIDQRGQPIADARVSTASGFVTRTSEAGVFVVRYALLGEGLSIEAPLIKRLQTSLPVTFTAVPQPVDEMVWTSLLRNVEAALNAPQPPTDGAFFGLTPGPLADSYRATIDAAERLVGFNDVRDVEIESYRPVLKLHARRDGNYVPAIVTIEDNIHLRTDGVGPLSWSGAAGTYRLRIEPQPDGPRFLPFFDEFTLKDPINLNYVSPSNSSSSQAFTVTTRVELFVNLMPATRVAGTVIDSATRSPIAGAIVKVEGLPYSDTTDLSGAYSLFLIRNQEVRLKFSAVGYNTESRTKTFSGDVTFDLSLLARDPNAPDIRVISGFPVVLDKLAPGGSPDVYRVSGTMSLTGAGNGLYSVSADLDEVAFVDAPVKMLNDTMAIPLGAIALDLATMRTEAFGFAPVDVIGSPTVQLRPISGATFIERSTAVIGGNALELNLNEFRSIGWLPISSMPQAYLYNNKFNYATSKIDSGNVTNVAATAMILRAQEFQAVYASPGKAMNYMTETSTFSLVFAEAAPNFRSAVYRLGNSGNSTATLPFTKPSSETHIRASLGSGIVVTHIAKDSAKLDQYGLHLKGFLELPNIKNAINWRNEGFVRLSAFDIKGDGVVTKLAVEIDAKNPLRQQMGKWKLQLDRLIVRGLGSPNVGLGAGGLVILKLDSLGTAKPKDNLQIKELSFVLGQAGPTMIGELLFPQTGIALHQLRATSVRPVKLKLETNPVSLSFDGGGVLYYGTPADSLANPASLARAAQSSSGGGVLGQVFPLDIQRFVFRSADWSVFMAAAPNKSIDLKAVRVNVSKLLINVNTGMTMDSMAQYLKLSEAERGLNSNQRVYTGLDTLAQAQYRVDRALSTGRTPDPRDEAVLANAASRSQVTAAQLRQRVNAGSSGDTLLDARQMSWAVGLAGTLEFPVKDVNSKAGGSILIAGGEGGVQVRVDEFFLEAMSPAFHLKASASMQFSEKRWGMEGAGEFETLTKKLAASFKLYKHNDPANNMTGIEFGASILTAAGVTTGPVMWHSLGGGFDFNTATQKYKVMALGELGPAGTPKEVLYAKNVKLEVLFDAQTCGPVPIVTGTAGLSLKREDWGNVLAKLDFCRMIALVEVDTRKALLKGASTCQVNGTLFVQAPGTSQGDGSVFLSVNARSSIGTIANGNILAAIGINMNRDAQNTPPSVRSMWSSIHISALEGPYKNVLNGIYVGGTLNGTRQRGSLSVAKGEFRAISFKYDVNASGKASFYQSFSRADLTLAGNIDASVDASLKLLSLITLNGEIDLKADFIGGYVEVNGWYFKGSGNAYLELYDRKRTSCNSIYVTFSKTCTKIRYWCGPWYKPWKKKCSKKICVSLPKPTYRFCLNLRGSFDVNKKKKDFSFAVN